MINDFWNALDELLRTNRKVIDRPKGTVHPRYPDRVYPLDYGYLEGTTAADGQGIDIWIGSGDAGQLVGVVCTVDRVKRDTEIKLLLGCSDSEMEIVEQFFDSHFMGCLLVKRA